MRRGSTAPAGPCADGAPGSCSICADEGVVAEVVEVLPAGPARVRIGDALEDVAIDLLDDVRAGDRVVVHLGFAIARVEGD